MLVVQIKVRALLAALQDIVVAESIFFFQAVLLVMFVIAMRVMNHLGPVVPILNARLATLAITQRRTGKIASCATVEHTAQGLHHHLHVLETVLQGGMAQQLLRGLPTYARALAQRDFFVPLVLVVQNKLFVQRVHTAQLDQGPQNSAVLGLTVAKGQKLACSAPSTLFVPQALMMA